MTVLRGGLIHQDLVTACVGGADSKLPTASLSDTGPVSFSAGGLDAVQRELPDAFSYLAAVGASLVSVEPPMWVHDSCKEVSDFIRFAEQEISGKPELEWARLDNPGAYALQERLGIPKADAGGLRGELKPLSSLVQGLAGARTGFLEAATGWAGTAPVKRYTQGPGQELPEVARLDGERVLALERVHVDRNRNEEDREGWRDPMRLTLILSFDEAGGTYFPYAELLRECPGVEALPTALDARSTCAGAGETWPAADLGGRGVLVRGRRGRLLVFASSAGDRRVPLYSSLHQGVLLRPVGSEGSAAPRLVTVIGAHGESQYETSAFHECVEHETIEMRADIHDKTAEQEAANIFATLNSERREEALDFLRRCAELRRTTVERIVREELERPAQSAGIRAAAAAREVKAERGGRASSDCRHVAGAKAIPRIWGRSTCSVCMVGLRQHGEDDADKAMPGYLSCGHVLCEECCDAMAERARAELGANRALCPECRGDSEHAWRPLLVGGEWVEGVILMDPAQRSPAELGSASPPEEDPAELVPVKASRRRCRFCVIG